ncbi:MAG: IgGFc-binding protein [Deltaproteobacteria bacterium]|nr:IgGFc-binding protein [Deltaproteobacteria bacterium]
MKLRTAFHALLSASVPVAVLVACGSTSRGGFGTEPVDGGDILGEGGTGFETGAQNPCAQAASAKAYVGCDYWPTVTGNLVQDVFDFAVAVANVGTEEANVTVTGPDGLKKSVKVKGGALEKVYLPWNIGLKGGATGILRSVYEPKGAFHLVSDRPVVVYQFNPLQFRAAGGEPGKDWTACRKQGLAPECYSYSNDASLLLPTTAMTGTYRIMGATGFSRHPIDRITGVVDKTKPLETLAPTYFVVTATQDATSITVKLGPKGKVVGDGRIKSADGGGTITFTLDAGDVAEVVSPSGNEYDFSGSLLQADKPVQVITGVPCTDFPLDTQACDHVEETLFPAETLGKHYVVMRPTGPKANNVGHIVRLYGNQDDTALTYKPNKPAGCPDKVNAGDVVECGEVTTDFEIEGTKEFGVGMFMLGGEKADPDWDPFSLEQPQGDPSQTFAVGVEQFRDRYVFLAPNDYKTSFLDVVAQEGTTLKLDGIDKSSELAVLAGTSYFRARIRLSSGNDGVHVLEASKPVGIQVIGYGDNTSYQYPGGLNLTLIAPPPVK